MDFDSMNVDVSRRMNGALDALRREFGGLRTGRASISLLEPLTVAAYGQSLPMNQVGTIGVPEPRLLTVQVWDKGLVVAVEKAIRESDLGLNPSSEGQLVRVPIPPLSEERRVELTKIAGRYAEESRVAIRNIRRHTMDDLKKSEKDGTISKDQHRDYSEIVQKLTDDFIVQIDHMLKGKDDEILQI